MTVDDIKINSAETLEETIRNLKKEENERSVEEEGTLTLSHKNGDWFTSENLERLKDAILGKEIGLFCFGLTLLLHEEAPTYEEISGFLEAISPRDIIVVGDPRPSTSTRGIAEEDTPVTYGVEILNQFLGCIPSKSTQALSIAGIQFDGTPAQMPQLANELSKLQLESLEILESDLVGNCSLEPLFQALADGMDSLTAIKLGSRLDLKEYHVDLSRVYTRLESFSINLERPIGNQDKTKHLQSVLAMMEPLNHNTSIQTFFVDVDHSVEYWDLEDKKKIMEKLQSVLQQNKTIVSLDFVGDSEGREFWEANSNSIAYYLNLSNCGRKSFLETMSQEDNNGNDQGHDDSDATTTKQHHQLIESLVKAHEIPSVSSEHEETSCLFYFLSFQPDLWIG